MLIGYILIGILAGYIASRITSGEGKGCLIDLFLGVVGSVVGPWLLGLLNITWGGTIGQIGTSVVGAVVVLWLWSKL